MLWVLFAILQEAPLMTEDMHEERLQAVEAFGNSFVSLNSYAMPIIIIEYENFDHIGLSYVSQGDND